MEEIEIANMNTTEILFCKICKNRFEIVFLEGEPIEVDFPILCNCCKKKLKNWKDLDKND